MGPSELEVITARLKIRNSSEVCLYSSVDVITVAIWLKSRNCEAPDDVNYHSILLFMLLGQDKQLAFCNV
jgi:hypothetical protein